MIQVLENLYCGSEQDFYGVLSHKYYDENQWAFVQCAKDPFHRAMVGYIGRSCPTDSPEYLVAVRGERMALNMVDANHPMYFTKSMIDGALAFIDTALKNGRNVLVHCNQGASRAPSICLLYMATCRKVWGECTIEEAADEFCQLYPNYIPHMGIWRHIQNFWSEYMKGG